MDDIHANKFLHCLEKFDKIDDASTTGNRKSNKILFNSKQNLHLISKYEHALKMDARTTRNRMSYKPILNSRQNFHQITKYEHALKGHADVASSDMPNETANKEQVVCCLKSLFGSCDVKIVVQNMLRETKRLFSPELRGIMGEEYPHFQNLDKKEKIRHLLNRLTQFYKADIKIIQKEGKKRKERERHMLKETNEDEELQRELESEIIILLEDVKLTDHNEQKHESDDQNCSALIIQQQQADPARFNNILNFWKDVDTGHGIEHVETMRESSSESVCTDASFEDLYTDSVAVNSTAPVTDISTETVEDTSTETVADTSTDHRAGGDLVARNNYVVPSHQQHTPLLNKSTLLKITIIAILGLVLILFLWEWLTPVDVGTKCVYFCDDISVFLLEKATKLLL
jgi:hypothetical protein